MRRPPFAAVIALVVSAVVIAGCSREDGSKVASDLHGAGHSAGQVFVKAAHDPDIRGAEADLRAAGHDAGQDLRKAAAEARAAAHSLAQDAHQAGHDVTAPSAHADRG